MRIYDTANTVGVFPKRFAFITLSASLPHARGGVSSQTGASRNRGQSSPRPWGCFWGGLSRAALALVFPTPVGVFPRCPLSALPATSLPHARGGVSASVRANELGEQSSPRPWGCF